MLSPIAESPQKERAAERDEEEELTPTTTTKIRARPRQQQYKFQDDDEVDEEEGEEEEEEEEEERLLNADSLRRRSRFEPMEIESGRSSTPTGGPGSRSTSPYLSLGTQDPSSFDTLPGAAAAAAVGGAAAGATHYPPPSSSSSSSGSAGWRRPLSVLMSTRNVVGQILTFSRGGMECPMPFLCDEEHPDPCECLCNLIHMPRVPAARHHYLIYRSPPASTPSSLPSSSSASSGGERIYTIGPHWSGLVFTIFLVCLASFLFITHVALELGPTFVGIACVYTSLTLLTLLRTACLDPGFITRSVPPSLPRRKFCHVCRLYTGPTAGHCEDCKICIEGLDHHCPWMGHCVGKGNLGAFLCFNCVWLTYVLFVLGCLAVQSGVFGRETAGAGQ